MAWPGREREGHHGSSFLMPTPESLHGENRCYRYPTGKIADRGHAGCINAVLACTVDTREILANSRDIRAKILLDGLTPTAQMEEVVACGLAMNNRLKLLLRPTTIHSILTLLLRRRRARQVPEQGAHPTSL